MKLAIDDPSDFAVGTGGLYVANADESLEREIQRLMPRIPDSHEVYGVHHTEYWVLENGKTPEPFTIVTRDANGVFHFQDPLNNTQSTGRPRVSSKRQFATTVI